MEKPIYKKARSHLTFGPKDVKLECSGKEICLIVPVFGADGICSKALRSGHLLEAANNYKRRNKRFMSVSVKTSPTNTNQIKLECRGFFSEGLILNHPEYYNLRLRLGMTLVLTRRMVPHCDDVDTCVVSEEMDLGSLKTVWSPKGK